MGGLSRRDFIRSGALAAGALAAGPGFLRSALAAPARAGAGPYGPLLPPNGDGLMLPAGFKSREIARGNQFVAGYPWHIYPDGQATFRSQDGGWILVSNSESLSANGAGSSAIRFGKDGSIQSATRILAGTNLNCAGGPTTWGTWLSCEEHDEGLVWECDPTGTIPALPRPALGSFSHEAVTVDPVGRKLYLTEDKGDSGFYRFTPETWQDLTSGLLEVAVVAADGGVTWRAVPDPNGGARGTTRSQVPQMTKFNGGEGIWYARGIVYFTTKGDKRLWAYDTRAGRIEILFDRAQAQSSSLDAVDNVTVSAAGDVYVCEDGGNMEIGLVSAERTVSPFLRFNSPAHADSELCGVVFDPSQTRMYFASQGAYPTLPFRPPIGRPGFGAVYEVSGPFRLPAGGVPNDFVFGPPAGEVRRNLTPGRSRRGPAAPARGATNTPFEPRAAWDRGAGVLRLPGDRGTGAANARPAAPGAPARQDGAAAARGHARAQAGAGQEGGHQAHPPAPDAARPPPPRAQARRAEGAPDRHGARPGAQLRLDRAGGADRGAGGAPARGSPRRTSSRGTRRSPRSRPRGRCRTASRRRTARRRSTPFPG